MNISIIEADFTWPYTSGPRNDSTTEVGNVPLGISITFHSVPQWASAEEHIKDFILKNEDELGKYSTTKKDNILTLSQKK